MQGSDKQSRARNVCFSMEALSSKQHEILNLVNEIGFASKDALASQFKVAPQTIRRDINRLCDNKLVRIADIGEIDAIFTDKNPPPNFTEMLKHKEVPLFVAEASEHR